MVKYGWKKWRGGWMLLLFVLVILMVPNTAVQAKSKNQGKAGKKSTWTYDPKKKTLTLSGRGSVTVDDLTTWNDDDELVWLGKEDSNLPMFQKVIFQEGITEIDHRFFYLENVRSISLPKSFQKISYYSLGALQAVNGSYDPWSSTLKTIKVSKGNKKFKISGNALVSKNGETIYVMPSGRKMEKYRISGKVTKIAKYAFWGCDIQKVVIGNKVSTIDKGAFTYSTLKEVKFGAKVEKIGHAAFAECPLTEVKFPNSLSVIAESAFYGCPLTEVVLPAKVSMVKYLAFAKNRKLQKIVVNGNTSIEECAFEDTTFYKDKNKNIVNQPITVVLGRKMKAPIKDLCYDLGSLIRFQVDPGNAKYYVQGGNLYTSIGNMLVYQMGKDAE